MIIDNQTTYIKELALSLGFEACGIARAVPLIEDSKRLENWLKNNYNSGMEYMNNYFDLRINPQLLVPNAKSVIVLALNYYHDEPQSQALKISKYAWGKDYHKVIKKKLKLFHQMLKNEIGDFHARGFVDSAPVLERSWAVHAGIGFVGKNGNLIIPKKGSYFFIATLICDFELIYDKPFTTDHCGQCTQCIDACPTSAILPNKVIDGGKCISYFTIESKNKSWQQDKPELDNWIFGCDICQEVCPWNRFAIPTKEISFTKNNALLSLTSDTWLKLNLEDFNEILLSSPLKRKGLIGIQDTIRYILNR